MWLEKAFRSARSGRIRNALARRSRRPSARATALHAWIIQRSGGRIRRSFLFLGGMPVLVLTTTGRKSGRRRSTPLGFLRDGEAYAVLAANAGAPEPPAWWLNLRADPHGEVEVAGRRLAVRARRAGPDEEARLWAEFARLNPSFAEYRVLSEREIPVVLLEPASPM